MKRAQLQQVINRLKPAAVWAEPQLTVTAGSSWVRLVSPRWTGSVSFRGPAELRGLSEGLSQCLDHGSRAEQLSCGQNKCLLSEQRSGEGLLVSSLDGRLAGVTLERWVARDLLTCVDFFLGNPAGKRRDAFGLITPVAAPGRTGLIIARHKQLKSGATLEFSADRFAALPGRLLAIAAQQSPKMVTVAINKQGQLLNYGKIVKHRLTLTIDVPDGAVKLQLNRSSLLQLAVAIAAAPGYDQLL